MFVSASARDAWKRKQPSRCQMADRWVPKFGTHFFFPVVYFIDSQSIAPFQTFLSASISQVSWKKGGKRSSFLCTLIEFVLLEMMFRKSVYSFLYPSSNTFVRGGENWYVRWISVRQKKRLYLQKVPIYSTQFVALYKSVWRLMANFSSSVFLSLYNYPCLII